MRLMDPSRDACGEARRNVSLLLDGELSELEGLRLTAHLDSCPDCRVFEADTRRATLLLRTSEPEELPFPVMLPRRSRVSARMLQAGAAAAAVALIAAASQVHDLGQRQSSDQQFRLSPTASLGHDDEVAPIRHPRVRRIPRAPL
jgi:predicted anti-sigma-YlaC factor YlaD